MKKIITSTANRLLRLELLLLAVCLLAAPPVRAGLTLTLYIENSFGYYYCQPYLTTNSTAPDAALGGYVISSPTNAWSMSYQLTGAGLSYGTWIHFNEYSDFDPFLQQITNGNWTILVTNAVSTNLYTFTVSTTGFDSNSLLPVTITFPPYGAVNVTNNPTFTWQGPSAWSGSLYVEDNNDDYSFDQYDYPPTSQTSWSSPVTLPAGDNYFTAEYWGDDVSSSIVASTPSNNLSQAISGWVSTAQLATYADSYFTVTNTPGGGGGGGGGVITGNMTNQPDYQTYTISDGTHSTSFLWSENIPGSTAWIYAAFDTYVAIATGITNITQITNAADYAFLTSASNPIGPVSDAGANGGIGTFVILKNYLDNYYAVVRIDDVQDDDTLNATWWFQTDGSADFSSFAPPASLGDAVNAPSLTWTTGGDADWFVETTNTYDGVSAAQSGQITDSQSSYLETTVPSDGQISFYWKVSSEEDYDYLIFYINGVQQDAISGEVDWNQETYSVSAGDTLRWEYSKDDSNSEGADAGWVDQVQYTSEATPVSVSLTLLFQQYQDYSYNGGYYFYTFDPSINSISPSPITTNRVESPDGHTYCNISPTDPNSGEPSGIGYNSLDQAIYACTNGQWTLYINKGDPSEQVFHFSVSVNGLTTSILAPVKFLLPAANAVNVATNTPFQWSGPANFASVSVQAYQLNPSYTSEGSANLPGNATNWPSPPALLYGTNNCYVYYTSNNFPNVTLTTPVDAGLNPVSSWSTEVDLHSEAAMSFVVGAPAPLPVQLSSSPPQMSGGNFQLGFQTLAGRPETIQVSTNLTSGWMDVSNFIGDGSVHQFSFPTTDASGKYFRVKTQ